MGRDASTARCSTPSPCPQLPRANHQQTNSHSAMSGALPGASVSSRFVSQAQLSEAQKRRQREIRDAYERCVPHSVCCPFVRAPD